MTETLCPMTKDGFHQKQPWQDRENLARSGMSCRACKKTWTWRGGQLVPQYPDPAAKVVEPRP